MNVSISISCATAEALMLFIAERAELWKTSAESCGVKDPNELPALLSRGHAEAIRKETKKLK